MQSSNLHTVQWTVYLGNHPMSHLQRKSNQLWLRPRVTDRSFSGKNFKTILPCLGKIWQSFFLYPACPVQTACILSVVERHGQFFAQKSILSRRKLAASGVCSMPNIFLGINRSVLPGAIVSHVNRTLSYLNAIFYSFLKRLKIVYLCGIVISCLLNFVPFCNHLFSSIRSRYAK